MKIPLDPPFTKGDSKYPPAKPGALRLLRKLFSKQFSLHFLMVILLHRLNGAKMDCLLYRECLYRIEFGLLANLLLHTGKSEKR